MSESNKYLKPMLDPGSPRVFNCNVVTRQILAKDPTASAFFHSKPLNYALLIKDTVGSDIAVKNGPLVGTKVYLPFNINEIYEGGRTIFAHDRSFKKALIEQFGEGAFTPEGLDHDINLITILNQLPSLDPFLMKDAFLRHRMALNEDYFVISKQAWSEIEQFMMVRFEPLVKAAFPDAFSSDDKARQLINTIWEARDLAALKPLIIALRLPENEALDIFASWKGIVYYTYQYQSQKLQLMDLVKWLQTLDTSVPGIPVAERKEVVDVVQLVKDQLKIEWQKIEGTIRKYEDAYDKMFVHKQSSADFLAFLKNSNKTYWELGNSIGKTNQGLYCWKAMTAPFKSDKIPWAKLQEIMRILGKIFEPEKKAVTGAVWN